MIVKIDSNDKIHVSNGIAAKSTSSNQYSVRVDKEDSKLLISLPDFDHFEPTLTNGTVLPQTSNLNINFRDRTNNLSWASMMYAVNKSNVLDSDVFTFELGLKKVQDYYELRWNLYKNGTFIYKSTGPGSEPEEIYCTLITVDSTHLNSISTSSDRKPGYNVCIWGLVNLYIAFGESDGTIYWGFNSLATSTPRCSDSGYHYVEVLPDYDMNPNYISNYTINNKVDEYIAQNDATIDDIEENLIAVGADVQEARSVYVSR